MPAEAANSVLPFGDEKPEFTSWDTLKDMHWLLLKNK